MDRNQTYSKGQTVIFGGNTYIADDRRSQLIHRPTGVGNTTLDTGVNGWSLIPWYNLERCLQHLHHL